jgi:hypothetical protein
MFASKLALLGIAFLSAIEKSASQLPGPLFTLIIFKSYFPTMITVKGEDRCFFVSKMEIGGISVDRYLVGECDFLLFAG